MILLRPWILRATIQINKFYIEYNLFWINQGKKKETGMNAPERKGMGRDRKELNWIE